MYAKSHTVILYYVSNDRSSAIINKSDVKPDFHENIVVDKKKGAPWPCTWWRVLRARAPRQPIGVFKGHRHVITTRLAGHIIYFWRENIYEWTGFTIHTLGAEIALNLQTFDDNICRVFDIKASLVFFLHIV